MRLPKKHVGSAPGPLVWVLLIGCLLLPLIGVGVAVYGIFTAAQGNAAGWYWAVAGLAVIVVDLVVDRLWIGAADGE